ncbi:MAG: sialate O-acetylesterase [Opitutales bacterium]|nr:sialate O-acetylesterase [Opitutales bacterium]
MKILRTTVCLLLASCVLIPGFQLIGQVPESSIQLGNVFSDGMVLQRNQPVKIWGSCAANSKLSVKIAGVVGTTESDDEGSWELCFPEQKAGGPHVVEIISGDGIKVINDVYFGDVWLASGQSNMEWKLKQGTINWEREVVKSDYPLIRYFEVHNDFNSQPQDRLMKPAQWLKASPDTTANFSAVAWYFAKQNHLEKDVPVGIIQSAWGGTPAQAWTPVTEVEQIEFYKDATTRAMDPSISWEDMAAENEKKSKQKWDMIWDESKALSHGVHLPDYDDSGWSLMDLPTEEPIKNVVWLRKDFELETGNENALFMLGRVHQYCWVFVNGELVFKDLESIPLKPIEFPKEVLKSGRNVIAVRAANGWNNRVAIAEDSHVHLKIDGKSHDMSQSWKFSNQIEGEIPDIEKIHHNPGFLYNAMIHPLVGYSVKGFLWYQGESNVGQYEHYHGLFSTMIESWRERWDQGSVPFFFTQLANFLEVSELQPDSEWAGLREAQRQTLSTPNTGMAVTIDIGETNDIHPPNKRDVGRRLWLAAKKVAFGHEGIYSGPIFRELTLEDEQILIEFDQIGQGLKTDGGKALRGFSFRDDSDRWHIAQARIVDEDTIAILCDPESVVEIHYAWADNPVCNLFNSEGLPASPFRYLISRRS